MPTEQEIENWTDTIHTRYLSYLKTSFYFKDDALRKSFAQALMECELIKGPIPQPAYRFGKGINAQALAKECFPEKYCDILPALRDDPLYEHQEKAVRQMHSEQQNVVVATGTASGKTESFLYPILFDLYQQHLEGNLSDPGVRALILYPMNALANDQRRRLGDICRDLKDANSGFNPTFGQYIGATPENKSDRWRNAQAHEEDRRPGELVFREEMRKTPPNILLTNYSMLEYLLIRPKDSELFDNGCGQHWRFIVLDEAHQYRGAKGMEMGMLIRRLKQRLREGGQEQPFRCIATSATISSGEKEEDKQAVAEFADTLFGEVFASDGIIFGEQEESTKPEPQRFHLFMSALEGAFLSHKNGEDRILLNRDTEEGGEQKTVALEIALCRECGQHYYVGREVDGCLAEAIRDPSDAEFGVDFYLPLNDDDDMEEQGTHYLCRQCGRLSSGKPACECDASVQLKQCEMHKDHFDQIKECEACKHRGGGDPVQEIVHGSDGPNSVIVTALHGLLPKGERRKILSFADSRQEAAVFAWYAEDSYQKVRDRNFILRALKQSPISNRGLSLEDLQARLEKIHDEAGLFEESDTTPETRKRKTFSIIFREVVTTNRRIALDGVGLMKWFVQIPDKFQFPDKLFRPPWNFTSDEGRKLLSFLLDRLRYRQAVTLPEHAPTWKDVSPWPQQAVNLGLGRGQYIFSWGSVNTGIVKHFLCRLLSGTALSDNEKRETSKELMDDLWHSILSSNGTADTDNLLVHARTDGAFHLNSNWLRVNLPSPGECFECDICASLSFHNIRAVCPRKDCQGDLAKASQDKLAENHYRTLYEDDTMPAQLRAGEHTAQLKSEEAQKRQQEFMAGNIDLLSSSTTFEVGVDLGDLETVFLRNVPPESFNYTQRVGRAGRGGEIPGLALTYCRRNPHDLYHYVDPEERILKGKVSPPQLHLRNEKIILRHIAAMALSAFFKEPENVERFKKVSTLIGDDWENPGAVTDVQNFCQNNNALKSSLLAVVPQKMHEEVGLLDGNWIDRIAGKNSRFADAEKEVCHDYNQMDKKREEYREANEDYSAARVGDRMKTIAGESSLNFLSRKAIIPKYGFPVDVVELDTRSTGADAQKISLQRDLSQAIAEYAPGAKVVANKKEWESCGVKIIPGKGVAVKYYNYDQARDFKQWAEHEQPDGERYKYLSPQFGFVTELLKKPKDPQGRTRRLYTTRPFFQGFVQTEQSQPQPENILGVKITPALPGRLVVLCEGKNGAGFYICRRCGSGYVGKKRSHKTPEGNECNGQLERLALGHEFVTDVVRLQFPELDDQWHAYSLAYAILLGAAQTLSVPGTDLNSTITKGESGNETAIVLYDNVPGGAGLVASLKKFDVFKSALEEARKRVNGDCGCNESCYGCIRSYHNQFAHPHLQRKDALHFLESALGSPAR